jgi:hypothetical protein
METGLWRWARRSLDLAARALVILAALVVIVIGVKWLARPAPDQVKPETETLEAQWNATISKLGIEPVYPPAEDLAVGDLLAEVVDDDQRDRSVVNKKGAWSASLGKTVKLAHVDVEKALTEAYKDMPFFAEVVSSSAERAQGSHAAGSKNDTAVKSQEIAWRSASRTALPRAAFPGFTIVHTGSAGAGVSASGYGLFHFGAANEVSQTLEVRLVETYGLPSVSADTVLKAFCEKSRSVCSEKTAREQLQSLVGPRLMTCYVDPVTDRTYPAVTVRVFMVSRVYLAHWINTKSMNGRSEGGASQVIVLPSRKADDMSGLPPPSQSSATEAGPGSTESDAAWKKRIDEFEKQLKDLHQGGTVIYRSASELQTQMDQNFPRGVAIGFRGVTHAFENDSFTCPKT